MKIFLLGYMGSGKSTIGKRVAQNLKMDFMDFDKHIEKEYGKTISEIFSSEGEEKFRVLEHEYLKKILHLDTVVIALGGGTPCFYNNMEIINQNGLSVYIEMSVDGLVNRLANAKTRRPLIQGMNKTDLKYFIETNLEKRVPIYRQANRTVKAGKESIEEIADTISRIVIQNQLK